MGEKLKSVGNRLGNTALVAPRVAGSILNTAVDISDTLLGIPNDVINITKNTLHNIKDVFTNSWTKGKIGKIIISPIIATGTAVEGSIRAVVTPAVNAVVNSWNTIKNTGKNVWKSSFGRAFSKKPISDFSYNKLNLKGNGHKKISFIVGNSNKNSSGKDTTNKNKDQKKKATQDKFNKKGKKNKQKPQQPITDTTNSTHQKEENNPKNHNGNNDIQGTMPDSASIEIDPLLNDIKVKDEILDGISNEKNDSSIDMEGKNTGINGDTNTVNNENIERPTLNSELIESDPHLSDIVVKNEILDGICNKVISKFGNPFEFIKDDTTYKSILKQHKLKSGLPIKIIIGTNYEHINKRSCAPMNWNKSDPNFLEKQIAHNLAHELSHIALRINKNGSKQLLAIISNFTNEGKHLSSISQNTKLYKNNNAKAVEDACELFALYCNSEKDFDDYMKILTEDNFNKIRKELGLSQISTEDAKQIKNACNKLANTFKNKGNN